jgi:hypothetical protein
MGLCMNPAFTRNELIERLEIWFIVSTRCTLGRCSESFSRKDRNDRWSVDTAGTMARCALSSTTGRQSEQSVEADIAQRMLTA